MFNRDEVIARLRKLTEEQKKAKQEKAKAIIEKMKAGAAELKDKK